MQNTTRAFGSVPFLIEEFLTFQSLDPTVFHQDGQCSDDEGHDAHRAGDDCLSAKSVTCCHQGQSECCQTQPDQQVSGIVAPVADCLPDVRSIGVFVIYR